MSALSASHRAEPFRSRVFALDYFSDSIYTQQSTLTIIMIIVFNNKRVVQWSAPTHFTDCRDQIIAHRCSYAAQTQRDFMSLQSLHLF